MAPEAWGAGAGRALVDAVLEAARARGAAHVELEVDVANVRGLAWWERRGFARTGVGTYEPAAVRAGDDPARAVVDTARIVELVRWTCGKLHTWSRDNRRQLPIAEARLLRRLAHVVMERSMHLAANGRRSLRNGVGDAVVWMVRLSAGAVALGLILGAVPLRARAGEGDREVTRLAIDEAPDVFVWRGTMSVDDAWRGHLEVRFWKRTSGGEADTWEVRERFDATGARGGLAERGVDSRLDASLLPLRARLWQEPGGGRATLDTDASGTRVHSLRGESKHLPPSERYPIHNVGTAVLYSLGRPASPLPGGLHFRALSLEDGGVAPANFQQFGLGRGGKDARVRAMGVEGGISYDVIERLHHGGVVSIMVDRGFGHIARDPALALETWPRGEAPDPRSRRAAVAARLSLLLVTGAVSEIAPLLDAKEICRRQGVSKEASLPDALREIGLRHRALFEGEVDGELRASVLAELSADASADGDAGPEIGFELGGGLRCVVADGPRGRWSSTSWTRSGAASTPATRATRPTSPPRGGGSVSRGDVQTWSTTPRTGPRSPRARPRPSAGMRRPRGRPR